MITKYDVTVQYHVVDGFSLFATDSEDYLVHRRYIGYSLDEAMDNFVEWVNSDHESNIEDGDA